MVKEDEHKLQLLREILLIDDREVARAVAQRLDTISDTLEKKEKLSEKVDPIIEKHLETFVEDIPTTLGPTITKTLKKEIANSKDQVVEALYPIMGKMIKRYIQNEIKLLSENINSKVNNTFTMAALRRKLKALFSGVKESDMIIAESNAPMVNEVFVIEKGSGILMGNYSTTETMDKDMVSGMLTAIKSFVEDAFSGGAQKLEAIEYELYTIHIQNFYSFYIAAVVSGNYTRSFESDLENDLLELSKQLTPVIGDTLSQEETNFVLQRHFRNYNESK